MKWLIVAAGAALCVAGCGDSQPASTPSHVVRPPPCHPSQLRIRNGPEVSPATGQNPFSIVLTNRSAKPCTVKGYPSVAFINTHGKRLPFPVSHGGDQMVNSRPPVAVRVGGLRSAFFVLNKYRCDQGNRAVAKNLRVALPGIQTAARLVIAIPTYPVIAYCGRNDPGSVVTVSPIVPTLRSALAFR